MRPGELLPPSCRSLVFSLELSPYARVSSISGMVVTRFVSAKDLGEEALRRSETYRNMGMGMFELCFFLIGDTPIQEH